MSLYQCGLAFGLESIELEGMPADVLSYGTGKGLAPVRSEFHGARGRFRRHAGVARPGIAHSASHSASHGGPLVSARGSP
jgi:hypothetical protein